MDSERSAAVPDLSCAGCGQPLDVSEKAWFESADGTVSARPMPGIEEASAGAPAWHANCFVPHKLR